MHPDSGSADGGWSASVLEPERHIPANLAFELSAAANKQGPHDGHVFGYDVANSRRLGAVYVAGALAFAVLLSVVAWQYGEPGPWVFAAIVAAAALYFAYTTFTDMRHDRTFFLLVSPRYVAYATGGQALWRPTSQVVRFEKQAIAQRPALVMVTAQQPDVKLQWTLFEGGLVNWNMALSSVRARRTT